MNLEPNTSLHISHILVGYGYFLSIVCTSRSRQVQPQCSEDKTGDRLLRVKATSLDKRKRIPAILDAVLPRIRDPTGCSLGATSVEGNS